MYKKLFALIAVLLLAGMLAAGWLYTDYQRFTTMPLAINEPVAFEIKSGDSLRVIARRLAEQKIVGAPLYLRLLGRQTGLASRLKVGEYELLPEHTPQSILALFASGKVKQYAFTIIEGWSFSQLREALAQDGVITHSLQDKSDAELMAAIGAEGLHPEGQFLPDTYHFPRGTSDVEFLKRAHQSLQTVLSQTWEQRTENLPIKTPYEALILASIVEKETGVPAERPEIAGVFVRRLQKGMRLQTDPTVIYGMGDEYQGDIRFRDLRKDTPYNTYTRHGLPPTPIAMAGKAAIEAALNPADGRSLYFVAKGDGSHYFSATLQEHNRAVRKYQLKR